MDKSVHLQVIFIFCCCALAVAGQSVPSKPPGAEFSCQGCPIEGTENLFDASTPDSAPTLRRMLRGSFSYKLPTGTKKYRCVLKCSSRTADPNTIVEDWVAPLRFEYGFYAKLQEKGGETGCVMCFAPPENFHYLVLEDFGRDLRHLITQGDYQRNPQVVMEGIVLAVEALHAHNIMHGDIKPQNILYVYPDGKFTAKLCDLDKANYVGQTCSASNIGTPYYLPPEVHRATKQGATIRASLEMDMYALGLVLWQVANKSLKPALQAVPEAELLHAYETKDDDAVLSFLPFAETASTYEPFVQSCVAVEPEQRCPASSLYLDVKSVSISNMHRKASMSEVITQMHRMLNTLVEGTHDIPTLAVILPTVSKGWVKKWNPMGLVTKNYRLFFLCSHTHRIAACGPKGLGYEISSTRPWVKDAAPVLSVGLGALKAALDFVGRPLPLPANVPELLGIENLNRDYLNAVLSLVRNPLVEAARDLSPEELARVQVDDKIVGQGYTIRERSRLAYETIKDVLKNNGDENIPVTCGLVKVSPRGYTAWVLDDPAVIADYTASVDKKPMR